MRVLEQKLRRLGMCGDDLLMMNFERGLDLGFINATFDLGKLESEKAKTRGGGADVIDDYLQLPMPIIEDEAKRGKVIRVWMKVESDESANDPETKELNVSGISRMDLVDYWAGSEEDDEKSDAIFIVTL